jgi:DNA-binding IclR family transcriptional regulator
MQHVSYLQRSLLLARAQKHMLRIVSEEPIGFELSATALRRGLPRTTMQRALEALERQHFLRRDLAGSTPTWRFEDPFMRAWLATFVSQSRTNLEALASNPCSRRERMSKCFGAS